MRPALGLLRRDVRPVGQLRRPTGGGLRRISASQMATRVVLLGSKKVLDVRDAHHPRSMNAAKGALGPPEFTTHRAGRPGGGCPPLANAWDQIPPSTRRTPYDYGRNTNAAAIK